MLIQEIFAGDSFSYSNSVILSNTVSWSVNSMVVNMDLNPILVNNVNVGLLTANLVPITTNTPNTFNFTLNISSDSNTTAQWLHNSVDYNERYLYVSTKFTSNTGTIIQEPLVILGVKRNGWF